jgi:uncharacterized protein YutE (UPF0331/DUF86 family)
MTDAVVVLRKLATVREHVARVRRRRPETPALLRADVNLQDALAMSLLVAVQEATDVAFHIVADEAWGVPSSYADGYVILSQRGIIDGVLADEMSRLVAMRNRLAHGYATLDVDRIWAEVPAGLDALERYATTIARFVPPPTG